MGSPDGPRVGDSVVGASEVGGSVVGVYEGMRLSVTVGTFVGTIVRSSVGDRDEGIEGARVGA